MAQVALAWVLGQRGVTSVLAGARHPEQIRENVQAAELVLPPEVMDELTAVTDALKSALGRNPDQYQGVSRFR
jgi:aryl-alcohol dehydrogenase-like predicted oxidoreductase